MRAFILAVLLPASLFSQTLLNSFTIDTSQYNNSVSVSVFMLQGNSAIGGFAYLKKNSTVLDIYPFVGTKTSITVSTAGESHYGKVFYVAKGYVDTGWACSFMSEDTVRVSGTLTVTYTSRLYNSAGTQLLNVSGYYYFTTDGKSTYYYTISPSYANNTFRIYTLRTSIASAAPGSAKQIAAATPSPQTCAFMPSGALQVNLQALGNGSTSISLIDLLGRTVYSGVLPADHASSSFIVPAAEVPSSPFIAKIGVDGNTYSQKVIPVK